MKLLIAFALFAVACADKIRVFNPEELFPVNTRPSMGQMIIPNDVIESWKKDIDAIKIAVPVMRDEPVAADDEGLKVHFVDAPLEVAVPEPVILGEAPMPAYETAESAPDAIRVVNPFDVAPVMVDAIKVVEPVLPEFVQPVQIAEAPLEAAPEPIRIAEPVLPALEIAEASAPVEPIKIAVPEFRDYRGDKFDNPMMRSADAIKVVKPEIVDYRIEYFNDPMLR